MRYRTKPCEVEAINWTGHNFDDVNSFVNGMCKIESDGKSRYLLVPTGVDMQPTRFPVGSFLLKTGEIYSILSVHDFLANYEEVPE